MLSFIVGLTVILMLWTGLAGIVFKVHWDNDMDISRWGCAVMLPLLVPLVIVRSEDRWADLKDLLVYIVTGQEPGEEGA